MVLFRKSEFARVCRVAPSSITVALKNGHLEANAAGLIDDAHPLSVAYIARQADSEKTSKEGKAGHGGRPVVGGASRPALPIDDDDDTGDGADVSVHAQSKILENNLKQFKILSARLAYMEQVRKVIPYEIVARAHSHLSAVLQEELGGFDQRATDQIFEIVSAGKSKTELAEFLRGEMDAMGRHMVEVCKRNLEQLREAET